MPETKIHSEPLCSDRYCAGYDCMCGCHAPEELSAALREYLAGEHEKAIAARRERREAKHGK